MKTMFKRQERNKDYQIHKRERALAKKHARMKEQKELDEGMIDLDKARKLLIIFKNKS